MPDAGCRMQDAGCQMQDAGCRMQFANRDAVSRIKSVALRRLQGWFVILLNAFVKIM